MLSYVWKIDYLPAAADCSATALRSRDKISINLMDPSLQNGIYVWKESVANTLEEHISVDRECNTISSVSDAI